MASTKPSWARAPEREVQAALRDLEDTSTELSLATRPHSSLVADQTIRSSPRYQSVGDPNFVATIPTDSGNPISNTRTTGTFEQITSFDAERILHPSDDPNSANTPREIRSQFSRKYVSDSVERWRNTKRRKLYCITGGILLGVVLIIAIAIGVVRARAASSDITNRLFQIIVDVQPPCAPLPVVCNPAADVSMGWLKNDTQVLVLLDSLAAQWNSNSKNVNNVTFNFAFNGGPLYYTTQLESNYSLVPNVTTDKIIFDQSWNPIDSFEVQRAELSRAATTDQYGTPYPLKSLFIPPVDPANNFNPKCVSLANSPLGIVMWKSMATALGWPDKAIGWTTLLNLANQTTGWASVSSSLSNFGNLKLGMGSCLIIKRHYDFSTSGRLALYAQLFAFAGNVSALTSDLVLSSQVIASLKTIQSAVVRLDSDDGLLMDIMTRKNGNSYGRDYLHGVFTYEFNAIKYNLEQSSQFPSGDSLVFILPAEGTYWSDFPLCILDDLVAGDTYVKNLQTYAKQFTDFVRSSAVQNSVVTKGFRPSSSISGDISQISGSPFTQANGVISKISTSNSRQLPQKLANDVRYNSTMIWRDNKRGGAVCLVLDLDRLQTRVNAYLSDSLSNWMSRMTENTDVYIVQVNGSNVEMWPPGPNGNVTLGPYTGSMNPNTSTTQDKYLALFDTRVFNYNISSGDLNNILLNTRVMQGIKLCTTTLVDLRTKDLTQTPARMRSYHIPIVSEGRDSDILNLSNTDFVNQILGISGASNLVYYPSWITYRDIPAGKMPNVKPYFQLLANRTYGYSIEADDTYELFTMIELPTR
ncbi:hypothetical protein HK096_004489, partial [Nowakowskiella sp. JEL0078]